ncbi:uncharacterized protein LOC109804204 [Cajanus cajan]|uniref:Uncharacterized protein n=1 Tax=Cajanus cajan TaxID=3821 RepID=A0A151T6Q8_CAJCA|nr:uncharacterized protein LOC109804204 [Cajanus cajan]KYP62717.1 hypothetical protein KK1_017265 [Cajanus cajan]
MPLSPKGTNCNSPEFEFWMLRNPSFPQPNLLSADELFVDGVLLPLHLLKKPNLEPPIRQPSPSITEPPSSSSSSKRWKDIFKKSDKKNTQDKEKAKKKERKTGTSPTSAELNINIWPFSRSRSAGNAATRPKLFAGAPPTRKVNSAPCSRSNSAGESKSRKWPSSPGRPGVHVGRSSPVWQARRGKNSDPPQKPKPRRSKATAAGSTARVLNLNVPMCIGYKNHLSCRSDDNSAIGGSAAAANGGNIFNLRNLFAKKCVVTSH